ncbi:hypothetical protein LTR91_003124 [Friedmanniomyces endolithicus]|uniref:VIT domain-containing protein n=1 Tax=Friedmanniomyces endolithicus TaxID=329885 RepID=A0AAN6KXD3_9PEZI|nr:hypothetical protein LTR01_008599 [Friedmanniomyces endolithicus]KAK0902643.1 hypothetical protein LTR57_019579 [Friedmanniomyces endolithicus]KAK0985720.1 hypothetical protein LTS01_010202 [Friedmanniomyces endolithicus]KAK1008056.1 hypothetical protein LTR91_003124 [Friedmanniomyces endolithicus]
MFGNPIAQTNHICGCYYVISDTNLFRSKRRYLPQVKLSSHTTIGPLCFTSVLTQTFSNSGDEAIPQARYTFPLYDGVAVNGYTIRYAETVLKGVVKQKDDAKQTYQEAVERGETAGLLESLPAGTFGVSLANIPAKSDVVVAITYCGELKHDVAIDGLRYTLPTSIAPKYGSYPGELIHDNTLPSGGISITVDMDMIGSAIRKVQSPSHPIAVSSGSLSTTSPTSPFKPHLSSATLTLGTTELAQDFILQLLIDDLNLPRAVLETHPTLPAHRAILTTLVPHFTLAPTAQPPEVVFIADQSGSMGGPKNASLQKALLVFLKSLPLGVRFNICAFGTEHTFLWPRSQVYSAANLQRAVEFVGTFQAAYGGTEILKPLITAFQQRLSDLPLEVILLTDGQVWREEEVFRFIDQQIRGKGVDARVFALGIGDGVSHSLVEGVARAGRGSAQFVAGGEERTGVEGKVVRMLRGALYAHTRDYRLEVVYAEEEEEKVEHGRVVSSAEEMEDDFELVEKSDGSFQIDEDTSEVPATDDTNEKPAASFFDPTAILDAPIASSQLPVNRYAHLPPVTLPPLLQAPAIIPPLFPFNRTTLYLLLGPETPQKRISAILLRATSAQGPLELRIPVDYLASSGKAAVPTVHQLAARKAIQDLEAGGGWLSTATTPATDSAGFGGPEVAIKERYPSRFDELLEREAVRLGTKFQVAGKWTSFVAVQEGGAAGETSDGVRYPMDAELLLDTRVDSVQACMSGSTKQRMSAPIQHAKRAASSAGGSLFGGFARSAGTVGGGLFGGFGRTVSRAESGSLFGGAPPISLCSASTNGSTGFGAPAPPPTSREGQAYDASASSPFRPTGPFASASSPFAAAPPPPSSSTTSFGGTATSAAYALQALSIPGGSSGGLFGAAGLFGRSAVMNSPPPPPPPPRGAPFRSARLASPPASTTSFGAVNAYAPGRPAANTSPNFGAPPYTAMITESGTSDSDPVTAMHKLISLQTFSGAWLWSDELANAIGCGSEVLRSPWQIGGSISSAAKATAIALAFLRCRVGGEKDVWEMVGEKAMEWLRKETDLSPGGVEKVVQEAERRVRGMDGNMSICKDG